MGFLSEQEKEKEERKRELSIESEEGEKAGEEETKEEINEDDLKNETDIAIEKCEHNFHSLMVDMFKRFDSIDFEHIREAFKRAITKLENEYVDNMESLI